MEKRKRRKLQKCNFFSTSSCWLGRAARWKPSPVLTSPKNLITALGLQPHYHIIVLNCDIRCRLLRQRFGNMLRRSRNQPPSFHIFTVASEIRCACDASSSGQVCQRVMKGPGWLLCFTIKLIFPERHPRTRTTPPPKLSAYIGREAVMTTPGALAPRQIAEEHLLLHQECSQRMFLLREAASAQRLSPFSIPKDERLYSILRQVGFFPLVYGCTIFLPH